MTKLRRKSTRATSLHPGANAVSPSARAAGDAAASARALGDVARRCAWCGKPFLPNKYNPGQAFCETSHRQAAWRARQILVSEGLGDGAKRLGYADPPYPGKARRYYGNQPDFAGEVDHEALIAELVFFDGWALSTSRDALREVLPLCPSEAIVCSWHKVHHHPKARGPANVWEPLIVVPARRLLPGVPDTLRTQAARFGGTLPGRKPRKFVLWMFALLGAEPGDDFTDRFPGTGIVGRCWRQFCRAASCSSPGDGACRAASLTPAGTPLLGGIS